MKIRVFKNLTKAAFVVAFLLSIGVQAQKWSGEYGNEWIVPGQEYAVIKINSKGVYQVNRTDLPDEFPAFDLTKLQLWHRGKQVAILEKDVDKIVFYGEPNDGSFDELLCRPDPSRPLITGRMNKFVSLFSDYSAYFLTVDSRAVGGGFVSPLEVQKIQTENLPAASLTENVHMKTDTIVFVNDYSTSTNPYSTFPSYFNSFYSFSQSLTGVRQTRLSAPVVQGFTLNRLNNNGTAPKVRVLLHNRGNTKCKIEIKVKAKDGTERVVTQSVGDPVDPTNTTIPAITLDEFKAFEYEFNLRSSDFDADGVGQISFVVKDGVLQNYYSVAFIAITYPQNLTALNRTYYTLNLPEAPSSGASTIEVSDLFGGTAEFLNITDKSSPIVLNTNTPSSFKIPREQSEGLNLFVYSVKKTVAKLKIGRFVGQSTNYDDYKAKDYFIITTNALKASAQQYENYRKTTYNKVSGVNFKTLLLTAEDIYNQYNFGEPSAVAIRRCIDFLISDGNFKKYLFLIGNANNLDKGIKELPDQVPTIGYPGSDFLLVSGLGGNTNPDFQTIAVGRLPVGESYKVDDYLLKVQKYEDYSNLPSLLWRKNVVHYNGGKDKDEIELYAGYLSSANSLYINPYGGTTFPFLKDVNNPCPTGLTGFQDCQTYATTDISTKLNDGAGIITYFGHGNPRVTDYFAGYVTDASRNVSNYGKYPGYFLYGCDVNNVFAGNNEYITYDLGESGRRPFTVDWLITPGKGAITVVGNSWEGYADQLKPFLEKTYAKLFVSDNNKTSLGNILKGVSNSTLGALPGYGSRIAAIEPTFPGYNYNFTQANVHQTMLLGDPAITLLLQKSPATALPVTWLSVNAKMTEDSEVLVEWKTSSEVNNEKFTVQRSHNGKSFEDIGSVDAKGNTDLQSAYSFRDRSPLVGQNYYRIAQIDKTDTKDNSSGTTSRIVVVDNVVADNVVVYPNPTAHLIRINSSKVDLQSWDLVDANGKVVSRNKTGNSVDLSGFSDGVYFLNIKTKTGGLVVKKIVKGSN